MQPMSRLANVISNDALTCNEISGQPTEVVLGNPFEDGEESDEVVADEVDGVEPALLQVLDGGNDVYVGVLVGAHYVTSNILDPLTRHWERWKVRGEKERDGTIELWR